ILIDFIQTQNQMTTIQTNQIRVHKSKHASVAKKELSEEDKARLQAIDEAITNGFKIASDFATSERSRRKAVQIPQLQIQSSVQTPLRSRELTINDEEEPQREIQTERPRRRKYNININIKKFHVKLLRNSSQIRFGDALIHERKVKISYLTLITISNSGHQQHKKKRKILKLLWKSH
ncbi:MAG: hypothetical protein EZS28_054869, partial [Streblomastix strix]